MPTRAPGLIGGKGDGIRRNDQTPVAFVDDGRVLADLGSDEQARIVLRQVLQE